MSTKSNGKIWSEFRLVLRRGRQVWKTVPRRHKAALMVAAILMALASAATIVASLAIGTLVDRVGKGLVDESGGQSLFNVALTFLAVIAGAVFLREAINVARRFLVENTCTRIDKHLSVKVIGHLMQADLSTLTHEKIGTLHGRIFRSVDGYMRLLRMSFLDFFPALLTGAFALATALFKQPWLAVAMVGVIPASVALTVWQLQSQRGIRLGLIRSREELDGTVVELLGGIDYVRVANTHHQEMQRVAKAAEHRRRKELKHHVAMSLFGSGKALIEGFFHILVLSLAIYLAVHREISVGDIFVFSALFLSVMTPLSEVHRVIDEGHECSLRVGDLMEILHAPTDRSFHTPTHTAPILDDGAAVIEAKDLRVDYHTADGTEATALDGLTVAIRPGETVGIAGKSGCGKSTFIKVLMRLVHPSGGSVRLKGVPLEGVSREALAKLIGYVGQAPFVFEGTIEENIAYGFTGTYLPEDVRRAAELACIHDEIAAMPEGYATKVAERGANLSGGQRQRIALARVFLKNPPILILDEATSALDNISERQVQRAIDAARADRTVILVAHRLSTLADADRILVFDNGQVVEAGTYTELVRNGGLFTELAASAEVPSPELDGQPEERRAEVVAG